MYKLLRDILKELKEIKKLLRVIASNKEQNIHLDGKKLANLLREATHDSSLITLD